MNSENNANQLHPAQLHKLAALVRDHCLERADNAYHNARMDGLCADGAWECAADALRMLDIEALLEKAMASNL